MRHAARKSLGQHFLHDPAVIAKIVATIAPRSDETFIEIGPGRGALTWPLLARVGLLHVIELDRELAAMLAERAQREAKLIVHQGDALRFDIAAVAAGQRLRVAGNLPYNVSTPLLFHLLAHRAAIVDMHLMLQKEVVQRMTAKPGGKDYGRLTVMLGASAAVRACFDIGPGAFSPPPRVWSSVVRVMPHDSPPFAIDDQRGFASLVARLFSMRRKTLARGLKGLLSAAQIEALGLDPQARPETLAPESFARLANLLPRNG
jgi:16S rRNA (adenine1518-N6/adenine1519-N6)-dimethyltransferase